MSPAPDEFHPGSNYLLFFSFFARTLFFAP